MRFASFVTGFAFAFLLGCFAGQDPPKPPQPKPTPFESADDLRIACETACSALFGLGCPESKGSTNPITQEHESCAVICVRAFDLRPLPLACWAEAHTPSAARACGSLVCAR